MIGGRADRPLAALVLALASAPAGASAAPKPVALTAAPARVSIAGSNRAVVRVTNTGSRRVVIDASHAGFALSLRGRPRIVRARAARSAAPWLTVQPARFALPPRTSASIVVASKLPRNAEPGDHDALVLLTTRPVRRGAVAVRARLGVQVVVRVPGAVVRRLELRGLRVAQRRGKRLLELGVVNRGNVTESLRRVRLTLSRRGMRRQLLRAPSRDVRPRTRALLDFPLRKRVRGAVTARIVVPAARGRNAVRRTYRIRI